MTAHNVNLQEYPDYYDVIKKPIDMERIRGQMNCHKYGTVEDMVQDFLLMFDNACKYNEPDSLIYKVKNTFLEARTSKISRTFSHWNVSVISSFIFHRML